MGGRGRNTCARRAIHSSILTFTYQELGIWGHGEEKEKDKDG